MLMSPTIPDTTPRSLEVLLAAVRAEADCPRCGAAAGKRCTIHGRGTHLNRFVRAYITHVVTADELAMLIVPLGGTFSMATIIRPPGVSPVVAAYRLGWQHARRHSTGGDR